MERFTISIDEPLAQEFDAWIAQRAYANRSEAFRDMVRAEMDRQRVAAQPDGPCVACLSYVYNHHERDLGERITRLQHAHHDLTLSTMHAHLDHEHCIETVLLKGPASAVQRFADALCAEKGVRHGKLNLIGVDEHGHHRHEGHGHRHIHVKPLG
jgi:CopG family transcriptional regulator, nickel-responsive regulator